MSTFNCSKCKRPIEATPKMEQMKEENSSTEFFCQACRTRMINERLVNHPKTVKYVPK
jgi:DNA-directed RNA polymerase subunit RPC12/RpoP